MLQAMSVALGLSAFAVAVLHVRLATQTGLPFDLRFGFFVAGVSLALGSVLATIAVVRGGGVGGPLWVQTVQGLGFGLVGLLTWRSAKARGVV